MKQIVYLMFMNFTKSTLDQKEFFIIPIKTDIRQDLFNIVYFKVVCIVTHYSHILYNCPRGDAGGLGREYVLRIPSVS